MKVAASALAIATLALAGTAFAQDKAACIEASEKAQDLRDVHRLVETRAQLRICASDACPKAVQSDCVTWLAEVERAIPSIAISAIDDEGGALVNVKVWVDGKPIGNRLGGDFEVDPGPHKIHLEGINGGTADRQVTVAEGERSRPLRLVLSAPQDATPVPQRELATPVCDDAKQGDGPALRAAGWVTLGVGGAGLVVGALFGGLAIGSKSAARCEGAFCDPNALDRARMQATVSTVGFVVGGVLAAAGLTLVLVAPRGKKQTALELAPSIGATWGASLSGRF